MKRYLPEYDFPPYVFLPGGNNPHPEKTGGYMHGHEIKTSSLSHHNYHTCMAYLRGIDLFNHGYFWEAHVFWEAAWNANKRTGQEADLLKALIKIAAGKVKSKMKHDKAASGHFMRALELMEPLPDLFCGLRLKEIELINPSKEIALTLEDFIELT